MLLYICNKKKERINTMKEKDIIINEFENIANSAMGELLNITQMGILPKMSWIEYTELFTEVFLDTVGRWQTENIFEEEED